MIIRRVLCCTQPKLVTRPLSSTSVLCIKQWRQERGLPVNKNAEGILTNGADYTFLDGRPTPLLGVDAGRCWKLEANNLVLRISNPDETNLKQDKDPQKQKLRMLQNQKYAERIVELNGELDFAKQRHQDMLRAEQLEKETIRKNWLKPKGRELNQKLK